MPMVNGFIFKKEYIKWATPFFDHYNLNTAPITRTFAIELTVKMTLSIISTWLTQPLPTPPEEFRQTFLHLTKTPLTKLVQS